MNDAPAPLPQRFVTATTDGMPAGDRLDFWRDVCRRSVVGLHCEAPPASPFAASATGMIQDDVSILKVGASACRIHRSPERSDALDPNALVIHFVTSGRLLAEQDGRSTLLRPGDWTLCVAERPFTLQADGPHKVIALKLPRAAVSRPSDFRRVTALRFSHTPAVSPLLYRFAQGLTRHALELEPSTIGRLTETFVDLLETTLGLLSPGDASPIPSNHHATLARAKAYVREHLRDDALRPAHAAAHLRLSTRYLNKLFEREHTSLGRYIWTRRLEQAAEDLTNPRLKHESITSIALGLGFKQLGHFSHAFRRHYRMSPREFRHRRAPATTVQPDVARER